MPREWDLNRRIVIRKLPDNATKGEIADLFTRYGTIKNMFIARNPPGFAFLEYVRRRDAELAVRKGNGKRCCGSYISAELTIRDLDRTVVIRNIKRTTTKDEIRNAFEHYGRIKRIWIERFQQVLAFLEYMRRSDAATAVRAMDGKRCFGCVVELTLPRNTHSSRHLPRNHRTQRSRDLTIESTSSENSCERNNSSRNESSATRSQSRRNFRDGRGLTVESNTSQRLDCSICTHNTLENRPTSTACGHVFCETCIKSALLHHKRCPLCQQKLEVENLIRMYPSY